MKNAPWLDSIWNLKDFNLPFCIELDNQYEKTLYSKYKILTELLIRNKAPESIIYISKTYSTSIIKSLKQYYAGDLIRAHNLIYKLVKDCCNNNEYAVSNINNSISFQNSISGNKEVQFFRARLNEKVISYKADEMLHIPFDKRSLVQTERFSIPGLPCLYLGTTSYICWLEMDSPADYRFNVSPVILDNTQKIFNLTVSKQFLYNCFDSFEDEQQLNKAFKLFMLNIATSFIVKQDNRSFKSEYIISQMMMLACKKMKLNGIAYYSKKVDNEIFAYSVGINLALFADYKNGNKLSPICKHLKIDDSFNYSMFKQLKPSLKYKSYKLNIENAPFKSIGTFKRNFPYKETVFYEFDKYLFANWNNNK